MFRFLVPAVLIVTFIAFESAQAQMFNPMTGARDATFTDQSGWNASAEDVGSIKGSERFLRRNRTRKSFVGRDLNERKRFVGLSQGQVSGSVTSSTAGLSVEMAQDANQRVTPATASRQYMYDPRLRVDFQVPIPTPQQTAEKISCQLVESLGHAICGPVSVMVHDETATLTGQVATEQDRRLAALIVLLEPGISKIENELTVVPSTKPVCP